MARKALDEILRVYAGADRKGAGNPCRTAWGVLTKDAGWLRGPKGGVRKFKTIEAARKALAVHAAQR